jgi:glycolate oxidase FAD binding subunit
VDLIHPHTKADVAEALREASGTGTRVLAVGGRRHMDRGNPTEVDAELWTTMLDEVVAYDPAEMLIVVGAGMRVGDLAATLAAHGQEWPVDGPPDATVGGVIAVGASSPRRLRVGLVRDTVTELELVTGDGRLVRSGARTVKNVTGYDVHRLATGSLGTLGVIVQAALKVRPLPAATATLVTAAGGIELADRIARKVPLPAAVVAAPDRVTLRLEGWSRGVEEQAAAAGRVADLRPAPSTQDGSTFDVVWPDSAIVAEASAPPSRLAELVAAAPRWTALAGVGLAWIGADDDAGLDRIRATAASLGGIAPVVRGSGGLGASPIPAPDVHRRLKSAFDPAGIMAPGRFWDGI